MGLLTWFFNFSQFFRGELTVKNLIDIPSPYLELTLFGTFKCAEFTSFIGGCIAHPIYRLYLLKNLTPEMTTNNSTKMIRDAARKLQGRFLLGGFALGPLATLAYCATNKIDRSEAQELCYKIRCNEEMLFWDRCAVCMGFCGWYWKRFQGAVDGINLATLYTTFHFTMVKKLTGAESNDKIKPWQRPKSLAEAANQMRQLEFASMDADTSTAWLASTTQQQKQAH